MERNNSSMLEIWRRWRSGYWNGLSFAGVPNMAAYFNYGFKLSNADTNGIMYFTYSPLNVSKQFKFRMTWDGFEKSLTYAAGDKDWSMTQIIPCVVALKGLFLSILINGEMGTGLVGVLGRVSCCQIRNRSLVAEDGILEVYNVKLHL